MKLFSNLIAALALSASALFAAPAMATTDCTSTIAFIYSDAGTGSGQIAAALTSGSSFYIAATDPMFKSLSTVLFVGLTTRTNVVVHFAASSVSCATSFGRTDVIGIHNYAS